MPSKLMPAVRTACKQHSRKLYNSSREDVSTALDHLPSYTHTSTALCKPYHNPDHRTIELRERWMGRTSYYDGCIITTNTDIIEQYGQREISTHSLALARTSTLAVRNYITFSPSVTVI